MIGKCRGQDNLKHATTKSSAALMYGVKLSQFKISVPHFRSSNDIVSAWVKT